MIGNNHTKPEKYSLASIIVKTIEVVPILCFLTEQVRGGRKKLQSLPHVSETF